MVTYRDHWVTDVNGLYPKGWEPKKSAVIYNQGSSATSSLSTFHANLQIEIAEFKAEEINSGIYVTFKYKIYSDTTGVETCVGAALKEGTSGVYQDINVDSWNRYVTSFVPVDYATRQLELYLDIAYIHRGTGDYIGGVMPIYVLIPQMTELDPVEITYDNPVRLTTAGNNTQHISVVNPERIGVKITNGYFNIHSSSEAAFSTDFSYDSSSIGNQVLNIKYTNLPILQTYPATQYSSAEYMWYYWADSRNNYVARCGNYTWGTDYTLSFVVQDNSNILQLLSCSLVAVSSDEQTVMSLYLTSLSKIKMTYSFKYNAIASNRFNVVLKNGDETLLSETFTGQNGTYNRELVSSDVLQQAKEMHPVLTITDSFNRTLTYDFGLVRVWSYNAPYLSLFDGYWSNPNGTMNLQSAHLSLLATFDYSDLGGSNTLTQVLEFFDASDTTFSNPLVTINNPGLVNGQRKYFTNTFNTSIHYIGRLTITDSYGSTSRKTIDLSRTGNVVMDFGSGGFGLAIGKLNEEAALEVNFPTVFYNEVTYPNGTRQRTDSASVLGCMDTYGVGATNIQDMLDYLVNKVLNG